MLMSVSEKIELIANIAIIVVVCLLGIVLVKNYFLARPSEQALHGPSVSSLGIDWKQDRKTLILAISSDCHF